MVAISSLDWLKKDFLPNDCAHKKYVGMISLMGKITYAPAPGEIQSAGFAFTVTGLILAGLGVFIVIIELFNNADTIPVMVGILLVIVGLLTVIVGYLKRTADATTALYRLNYHEINASTQPDA